MGEWKVSKEEIKLYPHPNADRLEVARVGTYSLVVQKGLYQDGDTVVFVPKGSILPDNLAEEFLDYLSKGNRIKEVRLRGELSQGIVLPIEVDAEIGEDVSEQLGIIEYIPPIPTELAGKVVPILDMPYITHYDVDNYRIFSDEIIEGEDVVISEKVHGSQVSLFFRGDDMLLSSKGILKRGFAIEESETNAYWQAFDNAEVGWIWESWYDNNFKREDVLNVVAEMIPCQKGFDYGQTKPTLRIFSVKINGVPVDWAREDLKHMWVPILYEGPFSEEIAIQHSKGMETVSGKQRHIREGCVVVPKIARRNSQGGWLALKFINPKYKSTGEEFN